MLNDVCCMCTSRREDYDLISGYFLIQVANVQIHIQTIQSNLTNCEILWFNALWKSNWESHQKQPLSNTNTNR